RNVDVGADLEREAEGHVPVISARGVVVEEVVDSGNLQLDDTGDGVCHGFSARSGIVRVDLHDRRGNWRKLCDGQSHHRYEADHHNDDREDRGKDRPVNEEPWAHLDASAFGPGGSFPEGSTSADTGFTVDPGMIRCRLSTTPCSPEAKPSSTSH